MTMAVCSLATSVVLWCCSGRASARPARVFPLSNRSSIHSRTHPTSWSRSSRSSRSLAENRLDVRSLRAGCCQPPAQVSGRELWVIVGPKTLGNSPHHHHIRQCGDHPGTAPASFAADCQTLPCVFIDWIQHPHGAPSCVLALTKS
jgi:hypothetical protein